MFSLFASLLKKYTRVTEKLRNLTATSSADSAPNHHDNSTCVVDCTDETELVCTCYLIIVSILYSWKGSQSDPLEECGCGAYFLSIGFNNNNNNTNRTDTRDREACFYYHRRCQRNHIPVSENVHCSPEGERDRLC